MRESHTTIQTRASHVCIRVRICPSAHARKFASMLYMHSCVYVSARDKYISQLSETYIKTVSNNFNNLVRPLLLD